MTKIIPAVKGTRDFYPSDMAFRNWLYQKIKYTSEKFGYQEYDGPEIEYLDLYLDKTSEEILKEQAFTLKDRDNRTLLLRPELTPTFARMVAQKSQILIKPIRWFSFGRAWRYEQPQKGRGREFFQWEINILGPETPLADAEIIALSVEFLKELGVSSNEVSIRINDRSYLEQLFTKINIPEDKFKPIFRIIDRKEKISESEFNNLLSEEKLNNKQIQKINDFFINQDYSKSEWLSNLFSFLKTYPGVVDYVTYDPTITRGLDYYTRTVFEAWDKGKQLKRALFGGGRFDNLTATLGGDKIPGVGMAIGNMSIETLLKQYNKMPLLSPKTAKVLITNFSPDLFEYSMSITTTLRENNIAVETWPETNTKLEKQLKYADVKGIQYAIIAGPDEFKNKSLVLKNLNNKTQEILSIEKAVNILKSQ